MSDRIDISEEVDALLRKLGVRDEWELEMVRSVLIEPSDVTVVVCMPNEDGKKHVGRDGYLAVGERRFRVRTGPDQ